VVTIYVTEYVRPSPITSPIVILKGKSESFSVDHVSPTVALPAMPTINLRQSIALELEFVTIINNEAFATVTIDTAGVNDGSYDLEL
jgi:hypothetical protein